MEHVDAKFIEIRFNNETVFSNFDDDFPLESKLVTIKLLDFTYYTDLELTFVDICCYLNYFACFVAVIFFIKLFIGCSLIKIWNYLFYL